MKIMKINNTVMIKKNKKKYVVYMIAFIIKQYYKIWSFSFFGLKIDLVINSKKKK